MREEIHVALCDDEQTVFLMAEELIRRYEIAYQVTLLTDYYTDAESLLGNVDSYDLLLLDIEMPDMDGIELGRKLLEKDYSGKIIILSGMFERFTEAFEIEAFRFVKKPLEEQEFFAALTAFRRTRIGRRMMELGQGKSAVFLPEKEIYCILAEGRGTIVFTRTQSFRSEKALSEWEEVLENQLFFRCHRQAIVNMAMVQEVEKDIILNNGDRVSLSRRKRQKFREKYLEYKIKYR